MKKYFFPALITAVIIVVLFLSLWFWVSLWTAIAVFAGLTVLAVICTVIFFIVIAIKAMKGDNLE